ncbi:MAG: hypothetical protein LBP72_00570 [Dysgonamonadaceae bacterium]|jgi:uncharacterized protein (TIGR02001 family)|nr:hypothetical protein [Dysgonamonadaceae bacterium]
MKRVILTIAVLVGAFGASKAQEFSVGADVVSSYVWRGVYQGGGASIQPSIGFSIGGFSLGAWGSSNLTGGNKEVDFTAGYEFSGVSLSVTDYWWAGENAYNYFKLYGQDETAHVLEATIGYTLPVENFPLSLNWSTVLGGADGVNKDGKDAYSSYLELSYPFKVKDIELSATVGIVPWGTTLYGFSDTIDTDGDGIEDEEIGTGLANYRPDASFSVVNINLKASKEIKITDSFSLPVFGQVIANPRSEDIFFVLGVSF